MAHIQTLLLTRPRAASERFAKQVSEALGAARFVISPLLEIVFLDIAPLPAQAVLVFTSRNGVEAFSNAGLSCDSVCYCVGQATADAARAAGLEAKASGGTVEHLIADLLAAAPQQEIIHIHGRHTRGDLAATLSAKGLNARGIVAYEQNLPDLSAEALALLKGGAPVIVPLFSPRSAAHFMKAGPFRENVELIAISAAAAQVCEGAKIASQPNVAGMIEAISHSLDHP